MRKCSILTVQKAFRTIFKIYGLKEYVFGTSTWRKIDNEQCGAFVRWYSISNIYEIMKIMDPEMYCIVLENGILPFAYKMVGRRFYFSKMALLFSGETIN